MTTPTLTQEQKITFLNTLRDQLHKDKKHISELRHD
jgi:hypothetical protein